MQEFAARLRGDSTRLGSIPGRAIIEASAGKVSNNPF